MLPTFHAIINGTPSTIVFSEVELADYYRNHGLDNIPALPVLIPGNYIVRETESSNVYFTFEKCPGAVSFRVEQKDSAGEWKTLLDLHANPNGPTESYVDVGINTPTAWLRGISIGATNEQREGEPIFVQAPITAPDEQPE